MRYRFQHLDRIYEVVFERQGAAYLAKIDGQPYTFEVLDAQPGVLGLQFEGRPIMVYWAKDRAAQWLARGGCTYQLEKPTFRRQASMVDDKYGGAILAPMPAQVLGLRVVEGDPVEKGQTLMLLEAMKMEIPILAPLTGRVVRLLVKPGKFVEKDQLLIEIGE